MPSPPIRSIDHFPRVTLRDIAKALGVSHGTVSRALHDNPCISLVRRKEIRKIAHRLGYHPNPMAAALGQRRSASKKRSISAEIAWVNYWANPADLCQLREFGLYWKGAFEVAEECGYRLEEFAGHDRLSGLRLEKILRSRNIRGILIPPHPPRDIPSDWNKIRWEKFHIVRFGYSVPYPPAHLVTGDQWNVGRLALERMHGLGYKRIGLVTGLAPKSCLEAAFSTRRSEMKSLPDIPNLLFPSGQDDSKKGPPLYAWLEKYHPDAILTDVMQLREMLEKANYRIPDDIGLAATSVLDVPCDTGIYQNSEEIGRAAMEMLISLINRGHFGVPKIFQELLIKGKWVQGRSLPPRK